jgi:hypothetical protein
LFRIQISECKDRKNICYYAMIHGKIFLINVSSPTRFNLMSLAKNLHSLVSFAKNCFVGLRPERARFALSPGQRPVVLVQ